MVAPGKLTPQDFQMEGQIGSRAIRVLIRLQEIVSARGPYSYVEIGSYLGRSLQPHLNDADCARAVSVDLRPASTPDERGDLDDYAGISAQDMVDGLSKVCTADDLSKLETVTDTSDTLRDYPEGSFDLALIDGEHTNTAVFRDFLNVLRVMKPHGIIAFDDTALVLAGIRNALAVLELQGRPHAHAFCRGNLTVVTLGERADETMAALGADLIVPEDWIVRRAARQIVDTALGSMVTDELMDGAPKLQDKLARVLGRTGWSVRPPARQTAD